jgi:hypothetical protein
MEGSLVAYKVFTNGSVLNASEINENLMNQSVMVFSNSTARSAALTSPVEGMVTYLEDTAAYESYDGAAWISFGAGGGKILQVVSATKTDTFSTGATTYQDITGLSVTITPTATSSKIMVFASVFASASSANTTFFGLLRDSTDIARSTTATSLNSSGFMADTGATQAFNVGIQFLDTPNTTSSTVYKVSMRQHTGGTAWVNRRSVDDGFGGVSTITVMEVAG